MLFKPPVQFSLCALVAGLASVSQAAQIDRPALKDSTILRSTTSCGDCPESDCYQCTLGHDDTLQANTGGLASVRSLVGFQLPVSPSSVKRCTVQFPALTRQLAYPVNVTFALAATSDWDETTVNGENAPDSGEPFITVNVPAYSNLVAVDITPACKAAGEDGQFSVYFGTESGSIAIWSKDSGNPSILHTFQA
ncbi:hypothetical protein B0J13DRAFT_322381 [Dactylonectria estremocensis]|uniref:Carbohydrate-binding module family 96 domain-containing protein n=1 Tax=Dactylonectria estremocensis TaxID=1079267 RepID=A0A9P9J6T3_9HYPO|nr:hypothetical protein B0J13DRAFT_322381 [Dactylonectria estremocensis]